MQMNRMRVYSGIAGVVGILGLTFAFAEDAKPDAKPSASSQAKKGDAGEKKEAEAIPRVSLKAARERAELMYEIYSATLDTMHHRYFHGERAVVPARAMKDVFKEMEQKNHSQARWISASLNPMSLDHEPKTDFEKLAAKKIAKGEEVVETIEEGYYRRAGGISLAGGCINCHAGFFRNTSPSAKFAGLIISIPVEEGAKLEDTKATPNP